MNLKQFRFMETKLYENIEYKRVQIIFEALKY